MKYTLEITLTVELEGNTAEELNQSYRNIIRRLGNIEGVQMELENL